jgi:hypothetical protein
VHSAELAQSRLGRLPRNCRSSPHLARSQLLSVRRAGRCGRDHSPDRSINPEPWSAVVHVPVDEIDAMTYEQRTLWLCTASPCEETGATALHTDIPGESATLCVWRSRADPREREPPAFFFGDGGHVPTGRDQQAASSSKLRWQRQWSSRSAGAPPSQHRHRSIRPRRADMCDPRGELQQHVRRCLAPARLL